MSETTVQKKANKTSQKRINQIKEWNQKNKEKRKAINKRYYEKNKEKYKLRYQQKKANKKPRLLNTLSN